MSIGPITNKKQSNEEKRAEYTQRIIRATAELFGEIGYDKTSMRQIAMRSGILTGSVYNIFESKDDILGEIICRVYDSAIERYKGFITDGDSILLSVAFPLSIYLHEAVSDRRSAELIHASVQSWKVTNMLIERTEVWIDEYFGRYNLGISHDEMYENLLALFGTISGFVNRIYYENWTDIRTDIRTTLMLFCTLFRLPMMDVDSVVDRTLEALGDNGVIFDGKEFSFGPKVSD